MKYILSLIAILAFGFANAQCPPSNINILATSFDVEVSCDPIPGAAYYTFELSTKAYRISTTPHTEFDYLLPNTDYTVKVGALGCSTTVTVPFTTTSGTKTSCPAPTGLKVVKGSFDTTAIVTWDKVPDAMSYTVMVNGKETTLSPDKTRFNRKQYLRPADCFYVLKVVPGNTYDVSVKANCSGYSNTISYQ